jgi:ATP-binding protein involved in chromosome partitioning
MQMTDISREMVLSALKGVLVPQGLTGGGRDVVTLGMISGIIIRGGHVGFAIEVNAHDGSRMEPLRAACERAVKAVQGVEAVTAVLTAEHSATPAKAEASPRTTPPPTGQKQGIPGIKSIIAVASGKGGVGKSTTAVNLALALKARGLKVGLLDADIYGPSLPKMLGLSGRPTQGEDKKLIPLMGFGMPTMSIGFLVAEGTATVWRGPMVMGAIQQLLYEVAWNKGGDLDVLVIDMPPGTGDAQITLSQRVPLAGAVIVSTPQDIALIDAAKGIDMFQKVNVPILGIVENMSYFLCPHCGERSDIFGHGGARETAGRLGAPFLGEVPLHISIRETSDSGNPIVISAPKSAEALAYMGIAEKVALALAQAAGGRTPPPITFE